MLEMCIFYICFRLFEGSIIEIINSNYIINNIERTKIKIVFKNRTFPQ